eukprot:6480455-Amphidinium_carterae.1
MVFLATAVVQGGGHVVIENPERSHLWAMPAVSQLLTQGYHDVNYVACAYGGARCKHQKLRTTLPELAQLSCKYVYPTAVEAEYTAELAAAIAATITQVTAKQHPDLQLPCPAVISPTETGDKTYEVQWHPFLVRDRAMPIIGLRLGLRPPPFEQ